MVKELSDQKPKRAKKSICGRTTKTKEAQNTGKSAKTLKSVIIAVYRCPKRI